MHSNFHSLHKRKVKFILFGYFTDWEFPGSVERGADIESKANFNFLISEFREAIDKESEISKKKRLLLSSAVATDPKIIENGYDIKNICENLDYVTT